MAGKRILVVGGGRGIGQYVTEYLIKRHHARVVILSQDVSEDVQQLAEENQLAIVQGDATNAQIQKQTLEKVSSFLGGLDSLVLTIGVIGEIETIARLDLERFRRTLAINLLAPVELVSKQRPPGDICTLHQGARSADNALKISHGYSRSPRKFTFQCQVDMD